MAHGSQKEPGPPELHVPGSPAGTHCPVGKSQTPGEQSSCESQTVVPVDEDVAVLVGPVALLVTVAEAPDVLPEPPAPGSSITTSAPQPTTTRAQSRKAKFFM